MKRSLLVAVVSCALAAGSTGAAPLNVNKIQLYGVYLWSDGSCPEATHVLVRICTSGAYPQAYVRLKKNEDVSSLENKQLIVRGIASKAESGCALPILDSPRMEPVIGSVYDCFD